MEGRYVTNTAHVTFSYKKSFKTATLVLGYNGVDMVTNENPFCSVKSGILSALRRPWERNLITRKLF
jgi:hypothetical protein